MPLASGSCTLLCACCPARKPCPTQWVSAGALSSHLACLASHHQGTGAVFTSQDARQPLFSCLAGWLQGEGSGLGVFLSAHMNLSHGRVREDWAHHHRKSVRRMQQDAHKPAGQGDALPVSPPGLHVDVSRQHVQRLICLLLFSMGAWASAHEAAAACH